MNYRKEMAEYHKEQAKIFHERAQVSRREKIRLTSIRKHLEAFKAEMRWKEYRDARDQHKTKSREYSS